MILGSRTETTIDLAQESTDIVPKIFYQGPKHEKIVANQMCHVRDGYTTELKLSDKRPTAKPYH